MKQLVRKVENHVNLYRDDETGLAWIEDGRTGLGISVHPNIDETGNPAGMKTLGRWGQNDRTVKSHGFIYNIDMFVCNRDDKLEALVADECMCAGCTERRQRKEKQSTLCTFLANKKVRETIFGQ